MKKLPAVAGSQERKPPLLIALSKWAEETGVDSCTAWRWRKKGWLKTTNICGRVYITGEALTEFKERAEAGEFAQDHKVPSRAVAA